MKKQIFQLNIPAELTRNSSPSLEVTVKTSRFSDGRHFKTEFIDLQTDTVVAVTNWLAVLNIAKAQAEDLWRGNARVLGDLPHINGFAQS